MGERGVWHTCTHSKKNSPIPSDCRLLCNWSGRDIIISYSQCMCLLGVEGGVWLGETYPFGDCSRLCCNPHSVSPLSIHLCVCRSTTTSLFRISVFVVEARGRSRWGDEDEEDADDRE